MVNFNRKLVIAGIFALIGLCTASEVTCPVSYTDTPQMRKAILTVDIGEDFFEDGWVLVMTYDKAVKDVEGPQTKREATKKLSPVKYRMENANYINALRGPTSMLFHVTELAEVKANGKYAELISAKIKEAKPGAKWYELCQPVVVATPAPPTEPPLPPCTDFYNMKMNDAGHGKTNEYEGELNITFPRNIIGFSFDVTFNKAPKSDGVHIDNTERTKKSGTVYSFKAWQSHAQIRLHKNERVPRWDQSGQFNFGHFKVRLSKDLPRQESQMPVPIKIVTNFHAGKTNKGKIIERYTMCQG